MKVIGIGQDKKYLCEVSHTELEKFLGKYYNNMNRLSIGSEVDLGKGKDYHYEITQAFQKTQSFISANKQIIDAILNGLSIGMTGGDNENITS